MSEKWKERIHMKDFITENDNLECLVGYNFRWKGKVSRRIIG